MLGACGVRGHGDRGVLLQRQDLRTQSQQNSVPPLNSRPASCRQRCLLKVPSSVAGQHGCPTWSKANLSQLHRRSGTVQQSRTVEKTFSTHNNFVPLVAGDTHCFYRSGCDTRAPDALTSCKKRGLTSKEVKASRSTPTLLGSCPPVHTTHTCRQYRTAGAHTSRKWVSAAAAKAQVRTCPSSLFETCNRSGQR